MPTWGEEQMTATDWDLAFDPDALRARYRHERDKRPAGGGPVAFFDLFACWRAAGALAGLELSG